MTPAAGKSVVNETAYNTTIVKPIEFKGDGRKGAGQGDVGGAWPN